MKQFTENGKIGFATNWGQVILEAQFDAVDTFYDPYYWHLDYGELCRGGHTGAGWEYGVLKDGKWGLIHWREERWITPCQWEAVSYFKNGLARVKRDGKWGFIDMDGNPVLPCRWDEIELPDYCRYWSKFEYRVMRDGKYGYLDMDGREILSCEWDAVGPYHAQWMTVKRDGTWYVRDREGNLFTPGEKENQFVFQAGLALVRDHVGWGLADREGREVIPCKWDAVVRIPEDVNGLPWEKHREIYSWESREVYPTKLVGVWKKGKLGIYDLTGRECFPCTLEKVWRFQNGAAKICQDGKWGLIDEQGRLITPCQWEYVDHFRGEEAAVRLDYKWGAIDRSGKLVRPCTYFVGF